MDGGKVERERGVKKKVVCVCVWEERVGRRFSGTAKRSTTSAAVAGSVKSSHISHTGVQKKDFKHL